MHLHRASNFWLGSFNAALFLTVLSLTTLAHAEDRPYQLGSSDIILNVPSTWVGGSHREETTQDVHHDALSMNLLLRSPLPSDGDAQPTPDQSQALARARGVVSVVVQDLGGVQEQRVFAARCRTDLQRLMTAFEVQGDDQVRLGEHTWTRLRYTFHIGRFIWQQESYSTVVGSAGYCITFSSEAASFAHWQPTFAAIIGSLEHSTPTLDSP